MNRCQRATTPRKLLCHFMEQEIVGETNTNNSEGGHTPNINNAGSPRCYPKPLLQFVSPFLKDKQVQRAESGGGMQEWH